MSFLGREGAEGCSFASEESRQPFPCPKSPEKNQRLKCGGERCEPVLLLPQCWLCFQPDWFPVSLVQGTGMSCGAAISSGVSLFDHRWRCSWSCLSFQALVP